jgi:SNF2 family DNA or RNA helicase
MPGALKPWTPRKEQLRAVKHLLAHPEGGIFGEPGVGKTSIFLAALKVLLEHGGVRRALIIAPLRVCYQVWPAEIAEWSDFAGIRCHVLHGKGKTDHALNGDAQVFVMNPEGLVWLMQGDRFKRLGADVLLIDESSRFRGWSTQRMRLLKPKLASFKRRWIGTGSPAPKSYLDLFPQIYCADRGRALGQFISHFRFQFFYNPDMMGWKWVPKPGAEEAIQRLIKPCVLYMENKDLPAVQENVVRVELPKEARRVYDDLEDEFLAELENGATVTAVSAGVATAKLSQISNGALYYENEERERGTLPMHAAKTEALQDLLDELQGNSCLVLYEFKSDLAAIARALFPGKRLDEVPYIGGGVTPKRGAELEAQWNAGELDVLLGHPAAMGHGLNLQKGGCRHVCFYGIPWDWELADQAIRRIRRPGNRHADVFVHYICAVKTIDEVKLRALKSKDKSQRGLLDALKLYAKERQR